jgi:hypothetical protein
MNSKKLMENRNQKMRKIKRKEMGRLYLGQFFLSQPIFGSTPRSPTPCAAQTKKIARACG